MTAHASPTPTDELFAEMHRLTTELREQTISAGDAHRLESLVCTNPAARDLYLLLTLESLELRRWALQPALSGGDLADSDFEQEAEVEGRARRLWQTAFSYLSNNMAVSLLIAGLFVTIVLLSMSLIVLDVQQEPLVVADATQTVATITNTHLATWDKASDGNFRVKELLIGDRLVLSTGLAEVTFKTGARILLEGPTELVIGVDASATRRPANDRTVANSAVLRSGKLVARVDGPTARGFTINTPLATVEDFGTEFGVEVRENGETNIQVYEGEVWLRDLDGVADFGLVTGTSVRIAGSGLGQLTVAKDEAAATERAFVRAFPAAGQPDVTWVPDAQHRPLWDGHVAAKTPDQVLSDKDVLYVKQVAAEPDWDRLAFLCFDLRQADVQRLVDADLRLSVAPTYPEIYHSGEVTSWRFELQGLAIEESAIPDPETMTWNNTRGLSGQPLAEFRLDALPAVGTEVRVGGEALAEFLQQQAGRRVVLMIRRLTAFREPNVVHAFASSETGEAGPVLYLRYGDEAE